MIRLLTLCICIAAARAVVCPTTNDTIASAAANIEVHQCGAANQDFTFDATSGHILQESTGLCVTVLNCGSADCANVVLQTCGASSTPSCQSLNQQWAAVKPTVPGSDPAAVWYQPLNARAMCMEMPNGGPNVDIYNCEPTYPTPITHQIWSTDGDSLRVLSTGGCLTAVTPPKPYGALPPVWPLPASWSISSDSSTRISSDFSFQLPLSPHDRLSRASDRYSDIIRRQTTSPSGLASCSVTISSSDVTLNGQTNYTHSLSVTAVSASEWSCEISAASVYGAMYAMESFAQLSFNGSVGATHIMDYPEYRHRGLMIDTGRRFFPLSVVYSLLDVMSYVKLNVLHLHASDLCRFSIESKLYPQLTAALTGDQAGHYSQQDIADMVDYAADRGIRVIPEFDVPGHSGGFRPLIPEGMAFCSSDKYADQLYNDPQNKTVSILKDLLTEMSALFPDDYIHLGCDETSVKGSCSLDNIKSLEVELLNHVQSLKKTPIGWEEVLFNTDAATASTVVDAWSRHSSGQVTAAGYDSIESKGSAFYLNHVTIPFSSLWLDIAPDFTPAQRSKLLGGEASIWSDNYCYIQECIDPTRTPVGAALYSPKYDAQFSESIQSVVWPRGLVAAGSFYRFNSGIDAKSSDFADMLSHLNTRMTARGAVTCPSTCTCSETERCGVPYLPSV